MNDMDVGDKAMPAREGSRVRFQGGADEYKIFSDSDSDGGGWKRVGGGRGSKSGRAKGGGSGSVVPDSDGEVPAVNPKRLWVKGNPRKMNGDVLKKQGGMMVDAVNKTLSEDEQQFKVGENPRVFGFDLATSAFLIFSDEEEAKRFYVSSRGINVEYQDGAKGKYSLRVTKDTEFDVRLRNQVYGFLKDEAAKALKGFPKWLELGEDAVKAKDAENRGVVFIDAGGELYEIFRVSVSEKKNREVIRPEYDNLNVWVMGENEADILVNKVIKLATLFGRRI